VTWAAEVEKSVPTDPLINPDAEAQLISAIMLDRKRIDAVVDTIRPEDFGVALFGRMFATIVHEATIGRTLSPALLRSHFVDDADLQALGGNRFIAQLTADTYALILDPVDLARQLVDLAQRREMRAGLEAAAAACVDLKTPAAEIVSMADAAIAQRAASTVIESDSADTMRAFLAQMENGNTGVLCHRIPSLDGVLGKLRPKSLNILAGRPGMGKTCVVSSYALGAADAGHGVLFVSLEMSREELAGRQIADWSYDDERARVPYFAIETEDLNAWQTQRVLQISGEIGRLPLTVIDAGSLTIGRLEMLVRRQKRRFAAKGVNLDLVIVDYLQLLHADRKGLSPYEATSEISKRLKGLAKDHDVAVIALAQLSRSVEQRQDKKPMLSDLRDSGQIEQDADSVTFLLRQEYYEKQNEPDAPGEKHDAWEARMERVRGTIDFIVAKKRKGSTGTATGRFYGIYQAVRS